MTDTRSTLRAADKRMRELADPSAGFLTEGFHLLGLFAIGGATVWAAAAAFSGMMQKGSPSIEDLLLLFIYLEIGSMVGIYFRTNHMPVRFLLYVGITALTRHMIGYVQEQHGGGPRGADPRGRDTDPGARRPRHPLHLEPLSEPELWRSGQSGVPVTTSTKGKAQWKPMPFDLIIRNATLPDGRKGQDVGVAAGRIVAIGPKLAAEARETHRCARLSSVAAVRRLPFPHGRDAVARPAAPQPVRHAARRHCALGRTEAASDA